MTFVRVIKNQSDFHCCNCDDPIHPSLIPEDVLTLIQAVEHGINCPNCTIYLLEGFEFAIDPFAPSGAIQGRSVATYWPSCQFRFECPIREMCLAANTTCSKRG